ncbi:MAG: hypothetical protein AAF394_02910 [Planctomycetota bacterium]
MENPYEPSSVASNQSPQATASPEAQLLSISLILLYCTTPFRHMALLEWAQVHDVYPGVNEYISLRIGFSFITTFLFSPIAAVIIWQGICGASQFQLLPQFSRFTPGWGTFSTFCLAGMIATEYSKFKLVFPFGFHPLMVLSGIYIIGAYVWWCNCIVHGKPEAHDRNT